MLNLTSGAIRRQLIQAPRVPACRIRTTTGRRWMSAGAEERPHTDESSKPRKKVSIQTLLKMKATGTPISMTTAYDYPTGRACDVGGIDMVLVGDTLAQVCLGHDSTTRLTLDEILHHARAVARGCKNPFLIGDMPFGTYYASHEDAIRNAVRIMQEGNVEAVKLEGGEEVAETVRRVAQLGIPVMGHLGLMPQRYTATSGYRVQGKDAESALSTFRAAKALEEAGAFAMLLEAIPRKLGEYITANVRVPVIGAGAGSGTDGQALVLGDMVGTWEGHIAKFAKRFSSTSETQRQGVQRFVTATRERSFPAAENEYGGINDEEWDKFLDLASRRM